MHPGIWLAFGDINGADFWRNRGRIEHRQFTGSPMIQGNRLTFATESHLLADDEVVCSLTSRLEFRVLQGGWLFSWEALFRAEEGDIIFGDQEEMGFGTRVATALTEKNGGVILNSSGLQTAGRTWGQPADWCSYSGVVDGQRVGITLMCDPTNFRSSWWHNRDYGLMVANPFGREAMRQGEKSAVKVQRTGTLRLRFGAWIYSSAEGGQSDLAAAYRIFANRGGGSG